MVSGKSCIMASKNDDHFIAFCDELRAHVEEHHLFPAKHHRLLNQCKYVRKKRKAGTLEEWKREMFEEIEQMRDLRSIEGTEEWQQYKFTQYDTLCR